MEREDVYMEIDESEIEEEPMDIDPPHPYSDYRNVATNILENNFMDNEQIERQKSEIRQCLEGTREECLPSDEVFTCCSCFSNRPSRLSVPCGHIIMCRDCAETFVATDRFYSVLLADGSELDTPIRVPLTCPLCRAIVGSLPRVVLPTI